mgnify:CR=1 FL=1
MVKKVEEIISSFRSILFPKFYGEGISEELLYAQMCGIMPKDKAAEMTDYLPELKRQLDMDVEAAYNGDPAAESFDEIICCYPVIKAMINYRIAHKMLKLGIQLIPRIITEKAHEGQFRQSGEPYFSHPCAVAEILCSLRLDPETIAAGLLHDCVEDNEDITVETWPMPTTRTAYPRATVGYDAQGNE